MMGRHPSNDIVLESVAISRHHAQITFHESQFFIEDCGSRNGTVVNGAKIEGRTPLANNDLVQICDTVFRFCENLSPSSIDMSGRATAELLPAEKEFVPGEVISDAVEGSVDQGSSSIITKLKADGSGSSWRVGIQSKAKLRAILELSRNLGRVLEIRDVQQIILEALFKLFDQVDEGFIVLRHDDGGLKVGATRKRQLTDDSVRISMTVVREAISTGSAILSANATQDSRFASSESLMQLSMRSIMCVPIVSAVGETFGAIQICTNQLTRQFGTDDLDIMCAVTMQAALAIDNATMHDRMAERRAIERELELARKIQTDLLPATAPLMDGYQLAHFYSPAREVGGDYYDYIMLPDRRIAIAVGDVAGKGMPAALLMARLCSMARYHILSAENAGSALSRLNAEIASYELGTRMITMLLLVVDPVKHTVSIASAGHPDAVIRRSDGSIESAGRKVAGLPLGIVDRQTVEDEQIQLQPGDSVVVYTDGVTESMNRDRELYGSARLSSFLAGRDADAEGIVRGTIEDVAGFAGGQAQRDDTCVVCLKRE